MNKYLPSKTFMKFFGAIIGVAVLIWIISLIFFRKETYENKNRNSDLVSGDELGAYSLDSDEDGVYDWEEGLWGTNLLDPDSNDDGVSDREDIDFRKKNIQAENGINESSFDDGTLSQTEIFARQFIATASLVDQAGGLTPEALAGFSDALKTSIESSTIKDPFTRLDIKLTTVTPEQYKASLKVVFDEYLKADIMELETIYQYSQGSVSAEAQLKRLTTLYTDMSNEFIKMPAPHNAAGPHLGLVNNTAKITIALLNIQKLETDPLLSMLGLRQYRDYSAALEKNINDLADYFY